MKISTRGRYSICLLIDLARYGDPTKPMVLKDIAETEGISLKYLKLLALQLVHAGILHSTRGKDGGYVLVKRPQEITVGSVLKVTELEPDDDPEKEKDHPGLYVTDRMIADGRDVIRKYFTEITIADLMKRC